MKNLLTCIFTCIVLICSAQDTNIDMTFIGNAGFLLSDRSTHIYFDFPYKSGAFGYMTYEESELEKIKDNALFIFTHKHADHYSRKLVKKQNGKVYASKNRKKIDELNEVIPHFKIKSYKTKHRFSFNHYSYVVEWHDKKFYISGDTEHPETIGTIKNIDYAFVPNWIRTYAKEAGIEIDTQKIVLYHLYPNQTFTGEIPDNFIIFNKQGETYSTSP